MDKDLFLSLYKSLARLGVCNCSMFCCTLLYVYSSIAIILMGKRELIVLLNLSSWCLVMVERLFLAVPWGCLRFIIVVFPDNTVLKVNRNMGLIEREFTYMDKDLFLSLYKSLARLGVCNCSMFCCTLLYVYSSIAIILMGRESWLLCLICLPGVS